MKLNEYLQTLENESIVAIGIKGGSGFIYIGEVGNTELIEKVFTDYLHKVGKRLYKNEQTLKDLVTKPVTLSDELESDNKKVHAYADKITKVYGTIKNCEQYIKGFRPVLEREVIEDYHKEVDDCKAVIIEGSESGGFWFKAEFDNKYNK